MADHTERLHHDAAQPEDGRADGQRGHEHRDRNGRGQGWGEVLREEPQAEQLDPADQRTQHREQRATDQEPGESTEQRLRCGDPADLTAADAQQSQRRESAFPLRGAHPGRRGDEDQQGEQQDDRERRDESRRGDVQLHTAAFRSEPVDLLHVLRGP